MKKKRITSTLKPTLRTGEHASTRNSKVIKAPRKTLYQAFTDPDSLAVWLAPGVVSILKWEEGTGCHFTIPDPKKDPLARVQRRKTDLPPGSWSLHHLKKLFRR